MQAKIVKNQSWFRCVHLIAKNWRNTSGGVMIITALMAPILVGVAGFAMDYSYVSYIQQRMNRAAEAAAIGATSQSAATAMGGYSNTNGLQQYGAGLFTANISQLPVSNVSSTLTVQPTQNGGVVATANYTVSVKTFFGNIVGISSVSISGLAQATAKPLTYINYYIIVDISQSMGIASTAADMTNLYNRIVAYNNGSGGETGCVFGCHVAAAGQAYTNEYLAHSISPKITLRIDSAVAAIQNVISNAAAAAGSNQNIRIGLYTMNKDPTTTTEVNVISAPSSNYASLSTLAAAIDLGNNTLNGSGDSDFSGQITTFNNLVPAVNGSGASAVSPLDYVFIITDGLSDTPGPCTFGHCTGAFASSYCANLQTKSTVGVIYTTYIPIYNQNNSALGFENNYQKLVVPYVSQLAPNLQACATSSKFYFQASDGPAINTAMQALFASSQEISTLQK